MSVYCDKFIGHILDVTDEYIDAVDKYGDDWEEKWICGNGLSTAEEDMQNSLGFVPYYSAKVIKSGAITLLYDGLNGEYAKIIYVEEADIQSENEENCESLVKSINKLLEKTETPYKIDGLITKVYDTMFNTGLKDRGAKPEYFIHFH